MRSPYQPSWFKAQSEYLVLADESLIDVTKYRHISQRKDSLELGYQLRPLQEILADTID